MPNLVGLHDREGAAIAPPDTWLIDTIALSENLQPTNYATGHQWITRANWGYGSTGTLPMPHHYGAYAVRLMDYVRQSPGCHRWIIGNEPNLPREWPNNREIHPANYAACYTQARYGIHSIPGHEADEVLIAVAGPWNAEFKYPGNPHGDWVKYHVDVIDALRAAKSDFDGFAVHAYTHGYNVALVTSEARMDAPFQDRRYEFRAYRDFMEATPQAFAHLPWYLTEANGDGPWQAVGLMQAMAEEINVWNRQAGKPRIHCLVFYRYPDYDQYHIEGKANVVNEFLAAVGRGYTSPVVGANVMPETNYLPFTPNQTPSTPAPDMPRKWDERLTDRGVMVETPPVAPGQQYWRATSARWYSEAEAGGRHHIYVNAPDGTPFRVDWSGDHKRVFANGRPGFDAGNYPMSASLNEFSVRIDDGKPSETVRGIGMGADGNPRIHSATEIGFELVTMPAAQTQPTQPPVTTVPTLVHPVADHRWRTVTQPFGVNGDYYKRFKVDGVPLKGHNGIDFGTPISTPIVAVDDGVVVEVAYDATGYGQYVKLVHEWGESLYAHLDHAIVRVGEDVEAEEKIGESGYSGNVIPAGPGGAHLHFGMRVNPFNRQDGWGGYVDPAPTLPGQPGPHNPDYWSMRGHLADAAKEFGIEPELLWSLAWAESSWNPNAESAAGAKGLMQLMDATWVEWSAKVGAGNNPFDAKQNTRAGAAYFAWLLKTLGNEWSALCAYNFGIGNVLNQVKPPDETVEFANKVIHGRDLLKAVGD